MKEASNSYEFNTGLRAWGAQKNSPGLLECYNMVPRVNQQNNKVRLEAYEPAILVSSNMTTQITQWPFPQLFCLHNYNLLCGFNRVWMLNSNFGIIQFWDTTDALLWQVADWWEYVVLTNGQTMYIIDPATQTLNAIASTDLNLPRAKSIVNFKGQFVAGTVLDFDSNMIVWSGIGDVNLDMGMEQVACLFRPNYEFTFIRMPPLADYDPDYYWRDVTGNWRQGGYIPNDQPGKWVAQTSAEHPRNYASSSEAGFMPMPWQGEIPFLLRLGDHLIAYGDGGVAFLDPADVTPSVFRLRETFDFGVVAVGGDIHRHLFLTEGGVLWTLDEGLKMKELGYKEWMVPMLGTRVMISYNSHKRDFFISNGVLGYILSESGLARIHQRVASSVYYRGTLLGTFSDNNDRTMLIRGDIFDMQLRGRKTIGWTELEHTGG